MYIYMHMIMRSNRLMNRSTCTYMLYVSIGNTVCLFCVQKADYCPGVAVSGVQSVNFSVDCINCEKNEATFQFRVYSESFSK